MKKFSLIFLLLFAAFAYSNDYVDVKTKSSYEYHDHTYYEVWFDTISKNPACVVWTLTNEDAIIASENHNRKSWSFVACQSAKSASRNYPKSGFDQGHMCPAEDEDQSTDRCKSTFKACNICPQTKELNRGIWQKYERYERTLAQEHQVVTVACGPIYYNEKYAPIYIGKDNVRVPDGFFKVFFYSEKTMSLVFDQAGNVRGSSLAEIEKLTGIKLTEVNY